MPPQPGLPLLLYLTITDTATGTLLAQYLEDSRKERVIYYASRKLAGYEVNYTALEKACVALEWVIETL